MKLLLATLLALAAVSSQTVSIAEARAPSSCTKFKGPRKTTRVRLAGNLDPSSPEVFPGFIPDPDYDEATTFEDLAAVAAFSNSVPVFDSLGGSHDVHFFYFRTFQNQFEVRAYVAEGELYRESPTPGRPRSIMAPVTLYFSTRGRRQDRPPAGFSDRLVVVSWDNGSNFSAIDVTFNRVTQYATPSTIRSIRKNGRAPSCS